MKVLDQRSLNRTEIVGGAHDGGNDREASSSSCSPATLAGNQLKRSLLLPWPHQHRLQDTDLPHGRSQLRQRLLVEMHTRLVRVGHNAANRQFLQPGLIAHLDRCGICRDQRTEPLTESAETGHR